MIAGYLIYLHGVLVGTCKSEDTAVNLRSTGHQIVPVYR